MDWGGWGLFPPAFEAPLCYSRFLKDVDVTENIAIGFKVLLLQKLPIFLEWLDSLAFIVRGIVSQRNGSKENNNFVLGAQQT